MSCVCSKPEEKWVEIPDVNTHCMLEVAKVAVEEFNKKYENSLKFEITYRGWYFEVDSHTIKYKLHIKAVDFFKRSLNYEVFLLEVKKGKERVRTLISFTLIITDGHYVGNVAPPQKDVWIKVPDLGVLLVQAAAKFAVDQFNKRVKDHLTYEAVYEAWYAEQGEDHVKLHLFLKAKNSCGHVYNCEVYVLVKHSLTQRLKTLISFKLIDVLEVNVQFIIKIMLEELLKLWGTVLVFDSVTIKGSYVLLEQDKLTFYLLIKAKDVLGRVLSFRIIILETIHNNQKIIKIESITVVETPGHYVGPVKPPCDNKWIKIHDLKIPIVQEVAIFGLKEIEKILDEILKYDGTFEGWYREMGGDDIQIRVHCKGKDCLGRVHKYEVIVLVTNFCTKREKKFISYTCVKN